MKHNELVALANLTNMCKNLNLDQGDVDKSKFDHGEFSRSNLTEID